MTLLSLRPRPRLRRRLVALSTAATALAAAAAPTAGAASAPAGFRPFADDSIWNLQLRADAPVAADSAVGVDWLSRTIKTNKAWINTNNCGTPTYWASSTTPKVRVKLTATYLDPALVKAWSAVPIPPEARPANCGDQNFAVLQTQADGRVELWEFFHAAKAADGSWSAKWGGVTQDVKADRGSASTRSWTDPTVTDIPSRSSKVGWNVTASSISMVAGVITREDLRNGVIPHALSIATPDAGKLRRMWPAQRTDGGASDPTALPEGAHLRLDPSVDVDALPLPPLVKMIARAAQNYGIVLRDRTWSTTVFYSEPTPAGQPDLITPLLDGQKLDLALMAFPWAQLRLLDAKSCTSSPCVTPKVAVMSVDGTPQVGRTLKLDTSNSQLEQPRASMAWDLDGDGTFERSGGRAVSTTLTPGIAGPRTVRARITMYGGAVVEVARTLDIAPADATVPKTGEVPTTQHAPAPAPAPGPAPPPVVATAPLGVPTAVSAQYFYAWSGGSLLGSLSGTETPPAAPAATGKAYTRTRGARLTITFGGAALPAATTSAKVRLWVDCAAGRCVALDALGAGGVVLASARPAYGSRGWVTLTVPTPNGALPQLRATEVETASVTASDTAFLSNVALVAA